MKKTLKIFAAARDHGLSLSMMWVLVLLHEHGPQPMNYFSTQMVVSSAAMTQIIDSLTEDGFVTRAPKEGDRRVWMVSLTDEGRHLVTGRKPAATLTATA